MNWEDFKGNFAWAARSVNKGRRFDELPPPVMHNLPTDFIGMCPWEVQYLFAVARRVKHGAVEVGRYRGGSTFVLACAIPEAPIHSVDIKPQDDNALSQIFKRHRVGGNVRLIVGDGKQKRDDVGEIDLLFIDGDHSYGGCMGDILAWYDNLLPNGHLVFHDSHLTRKYGVQDAIMDFMDDHPELQVMLSPYMGQQYWNYPAGSLAHLIKRGTFYGLR